jgi:hypothetical protein
MSHTRTLAILSMQIEQEEEQAFFVTAGLIENPPSTEDNDSLLQEGESPDDMMVLE